MCPAVMGKIRCPLRPASLRLDRNRPEILTPPQHPPDCCTQQTITVPPETCAKTAQKHDYPSTAHRKSYARRTGAERTFSTVKDPASNDIAHGWTRLMGLTPMTLWLTCLLVVRNQRILTAWNARQEDTPAAPPPACPRKHGAAAARPSPASPPPPHRPNPGKQPTVIASTAGTESTTCCPKKPERQHPAPKRHHIQPAAANHAECQTQT